MYKKVFALSRLIFQVAGCVAGLACLCGCAQPTPTPVVRTIDNVELKAITLARDGMHYYRRGRLFESEASLRKALYLQPKAANIRFNLALVLAKSEQYFEAEELLRKFRQETAEDERANLALARIYSERGDYQLAIREYQKLVEQYLDTGAERKASRALRNIANLMFNLGDEEQALCYSERALIHHADQEQTFQHVRILVGLHLYYRAADLLKESTSNQSGQQVAPVILYARALALAGQGDSKNSLSLAKSASAVNKDPKLEGDLLLLRKWAESDIEPQDSGEKQDRENELESFAITSRSLFWPETLLKFASNVQSKNST